MKALPLFEDVAPSDRQHAIYKMIRDGDYEAERAVLLGWSEGFADRDGKFCHEFQVAFEPCLWELYLHAYLREIGASIDFSHASPDFVAHNSESFCVEATIAAPAKGQPPPYGFSVDDIPEDFNRFNSEAMLRISSSFSAKVKKLREGYSKLAQCENKPFVIAIAAYDRPFSHLAAMRPILGALYGLYHDEGETIRTGASEVVSYNIEGVVKSETTTIDVGFFCTPEFADVSAIIFSSLATWGKVRAVADNPNAPTIYTTFHPNPGELHPIVRTAKKSDYQEHLLDGVFVMHNPFANLKLSPNVLGHPRIAQCFVKSDGELDFIAPDDFLLTRFLMSANVSSGVPPGVYTSLPADVFSSALLRKIRD